MSTYIPVSCELHDKLEAISTLRQLAGLVYRTETGDRVQTSAKINDIYAENNADYCKLSDGSVLRMDRLESVKIDGVTVWG